MTTYLVEAYVSKLDEARQRQLAVAARSAAELTAREESPVRYLGSIFVPEDETCFHLLDAFSAEDVERTNRRGAFAFERIVEVTETRGPSRREESHMPQFMVERHLPGFPPEQLPAAAAAAKQGAAELTAEGTDVRYLRSTYVGASERCYCLFEASSRAAVEQTQARAGLPYEQIHEASFLTAEEV
jgi:Protein of unknown function (DUF4242)